MNLPTALARLPLLAILSLAPVAPAMEITASSTGDAQSIVLSSDNGAITLAVATNDYPVVTLAAGLFADDVNRVTGRHPAITDQAAVSQMIIAGTLGHSALIDQLAAAGKLQNLDQIKGRWEATLSQIVANPFPGVDRALVITGSDRRGTAYGLMRLSEQIGVSPWYWWADVPVPHRDTLAVRVTAPEIDAPGVKYRGIFINDEDWGINPWAKYTFDPGFKNIGPKTYTKVFELLLRLRLNYLWPAMHPCSTEFSSNPENYRLADQYAIVAGSSHCEPMLCNNVHWNEKAKGPWNYLLNSNTIHAYWEDNVKARATEEAVWTLGIRGIHDRGMETPPTGMPDKIGLVSGVIHDQRDLLGQYVTHQWGPVAQCFVPYKEVLPIYDAGLSVPDDVTLVWVDDNFGYLRRLGAPAERHRSGGAGVYWHLSYYGSPHSYTWINTTAPALMWEELHKAWENDVRTIWVVNVGDIKPMEIGIDYFSRLAWNPDGFGPASQPDFLRQFAARNFGESQAQPVADFLMDFYRLGTIRKPELMDCAWALSLPPDRAAQLEHDYRNLLTREQEIGRQIPAAAHDGWTETIGFPARVLGTAGLIFMADRQARLGTDVAANQTRITGLRHDLDLAVTNFNTQIAGGKWNRMMPGLETGKTLSAWSSQVRWPWGEKSSASGRMPSMLLDNQPPAGQNWRDAATSDRQSSSGAAHWSTVAGLGPSGRATALLPASLGSSWQANDPAAPALEYDFQSTGGAGAVFIDFLPAFRICPGMKLRVAVSVDDQPPSLVEVPGSSGAENENGAIRSGAVQDNYVRVRIPLPPVAVGKHVFKIRAVDPGAAVDRISLP